MNLRRVLPFVLVALPLPAFASSARVAARIADLRAEPSSDAKSKAKLPSGRDLEVIGKSDDGKWVRVRAECPKANETIHFEGWLAVRDVQGANLEGLAVAGSAKTSAAKSDWSDDAGAKAASSDAAWGDDSAAPAKTDTASAKDEWGNDAAPAASDSKPAATDAAWGDDSKPAPAASSSDSAKGDDWGSSSDSSSSKGGGDEWSSGGSGSGSSDSSSSDSSSSGDGW